MTIDQSILQIRPRFDFTVASTSVKLKAKVLRMLDEDYEFIKGTISGDYVVLNIRNEDLHYWSPQMNFRIEEHDDDQALCRVVGLIGPRPTVWTLFVFIYFSVGITSFFISLYALSKYTLGDYSHLLWAFPLGILFMLTAYRTSKFGEKLGQEQTDVLKSFLRKLL